ncbi:MAG: glycosyltransferase family 2 protein [Gemmatimonadota bacterium]|jgi:glycosyltransferase involved in cell wall biosynthesis|nr:glycosyltransferase family 2 protein [Gemmatimonadota bacterium]
MQVSVIFSTYNQVRFLELVLLGFSVQSYRDFEIVIADDGSTPETTALIDRLRDETGMRIVHVWHPDDGFRKTEILNRAILASSGEYLIFTDGDCIPRADFVETHLRLARPGAFLSGGYLKLPPRVTRAITAEDVQARRVTRLRYLRALGWVPGRHALRLLPSGFCSALFDRITPTRASWNGHNASGWRESILAANGFDLDMAYGGEDRALGERLVNAGLYGVQVRYRAVCVHLHHEQPYVNEEAWAHNRVVRDRIVSGRETRARLGIAELSDGSIAGVRVRDGGHRPLSAKVSRPVDDVQGF